VVPNPRSAHGPPKRPPSIRRLTVAGDGREQRAKSEPESERRHHHHRHHRDDDDDETSNGTGNEQVSETASVEAENKKPNPAAVVAAKAEADAKAITEAEAALAAKQKAEEEAATAKADEEAATARKEEEAAAAVKAAEVAAAAAAAAAKLVEEAAAAAKKEAKEAAVRAKADAEAAEARHKYEEEVAAKKEAAEAAERKEMSKLKALQAGTTRRSIMMVNILKKTAAEEEREAASAAAAAAHSVNSPAATRSRVSPPRPHSVHHSTLRQAALLPEPRHVRRLHHPNDAALAVSTSSSTAFALGRESLPAKSVDQHSSGELEKWQREQMEQVLQLKAELKTLRGHSAALEREKDAHAGLAVQLGQTHELVLQKAAAHHADLEEQISRHLDEAELNRTELRRHQEVAEELRAAAEQFKAVAMTSRAREQKHAKEAAAAKAALKQANTRLRVHEAMLGSSSCGSSSLDTVPRDNPLSALHGDINEYTLASLQELRRKYNSALRQLRDEKTLNRVLRGKNGVFDGDENDKLLGAESDPFLQEQSQRLALQLAQTPTNVKVERDMQQISAPNTVAPSVNLEEDLNKAARKVGVAVLTYWKQRAESAEKINVELLEELLQSQRMLASLSRSPLHSPHTRSPPSKTRAIAWRPPPNATNEQYNAFKLDLAINEARREGQHQQETWFPSSSSLTEPLPSPPPPPPPPAGHGPRRPSGVISRYGSPGVARGGQLVRHSPFSSSSSPPPLVARQKAGIDNMLHRFRSHAPAIPLFHASARTKRRRAGLDAKSRIDGSGSSPLDGLWGTSEQLPNSSKTPGLRSGIPALAGLAADELGVSAERSSEPMSQVLSSLSSATPSNKQPAPGSWAHSRSRRIEGAEAKFASRNLRFGVSPARSHLRQTSHFNLQHQQPQQRQTKASPPDRPPGQLIKSPLRR